MEIHNDIKNKNMLFIGYYASEYSRNKVLLSALKSEFDIIEIRLENNSLKYWFFLKALLKYRHSQDYILIVQPAQNFIFIIIFLKFFLSSKIIFDAFTSIYDTYIFDRKLASKKSFKALYYYLLDYLSCQCSDIIIFDTKEHRKYFQKTFGIQRSKKTLVLPVAVDSEYLNNIRSGKGLFPENKFNVLFYGYFIPLQGAEYIIKAASLLRGNQNIFFTLIGGGQTRKDVENLSKELELDNVRFIDRVEHELLIKYIKSADICLGIFGDTDKAKRVIPNKVLDSMASGKVVITGKNEAMSEYFCDEEDIIYSRLTDEEDLAKKILFCYENRNIFEKIPVNALKKIEKDFSKSSLQQIIKANL